MPTKSDSRKRTSRKKSMDGERRSSNPEPALRELFIDEIRDIYWAEKKLVTALPKMERAASSEELKQTIADHWGVTKKHVTRLEKVFKLLDETARAKKCEAMEGLVKEAEGVVEDTEDGSATRDVAIILSAQKVEHYEIATYGGLATLAETLGLDEINDLLGQTLEEEKEADELLTGIAESSINYNAVEETA
jgi:ferritin-like metal-binding protein YciE